MKGSKLFIASLIILALAAGFFLGSFCRQCPPPKPGPAPEGFEAKAPHGEKPGKKDFKHRMDIAAIDSLLQVTPEQKAALEANRIKGDSIFKDLRKQKHDAEKALGAAIESGDPANIEAAKANVLEADKALLENRITGMQGLAKILSKEQLEKFNQFHKDQMKKYKERFKKKFEQKEHPAP